MSSTPDPLTPLPTLDPKYLWVIIFPIVVVLLAELMVGALGSYPITIGGLLPADEASTTIAGTEAALRLRVLGLFLLLAVSSAAIVARFVSESRTQFDRKTGSLLLVGATICLIVAVLIEAFPILEIIPRSFHVLGKDLFERAFELASKFPRAFTEDILWWLMNFGGFLVGAAVASLIMIAISSLATIENGDINARKAHWRHQTERLQLTIYISTGLLVAGLLFMQSWAMWPTFALAPGIEKALSPSSANYNALVNSYLAYTGIEYSLLLASFTVPVMVLLNRQANMIAVASLRSKSLVATPPGQFSAATISAERKSENLVVQFIDQLKALAAILAPFVAGSLGNFVTVLSAKS